LLTNWLYVYIQTRTLRYSNSRSAANNCISPEHPEQGGWDDSFYAQTRLLRLVFAWCLENMF